jgi:hypothetical protein
MTTGPHEQPFEVELRSSLQAFRTALAEATAAIGAEVTRPQKLGRQLGLDKSLAWHLSKILTEDDAVAAIPHLPGKSGMRITLQSLAEAGVSADALHRLREANEQFDRVVDVHCGDRATLKMMLGHLDAGNGHAAVDETQRKKLFEGASAVWGVQAETQVSAHFVAPSAGDSDRLDFATVSGLLGFRRLRQDAAWAIASVRNYADDGSPRPAEAFEPLDRSVAPGEAPLLREFCSDPPPELRVVPGPPGVTRYELVEGPVGNTAACDCISGWLSRSWVSPWRTEDDRFGEHLVQLSTPVKLVVHDLFVHRDVPFSLPPRTLLYSQLPGGPVYPQCGRDRGQLPLREDVIELGTPPDVIIPELPRHRRITDAVFARLDGTAADFVGYRLKLRFPPIPTVAVFRHELPARP